MIPTLGDIEIKIGGKKYTAKPTFKSLMMIEAGDTSLAEILKNFGDRKPKGLDIILVVHSCIASHDKSCPSYEELGELMYKEGYAEFIPPAVSLAASIWSGAPNQKKTE